VSLQSLELITTQELETLAIKCSRADGSPRLTDLERAAILKGIAAELSDRTAAQKSGHLHATERDLLQSAIENGVEEKYRLKLHLGFLEDAVEILKEAVEGKPDNKCR
jgi:hypothetical protein